MSLCFFLSFPLPAALRAPKVSLHPNLFRVGGNYTVYCNSTSGPVTNFTLSLYYRSLPVTPGTNWTFAGSVFLTDSNNIFISNTNAVVPIEFTCDMEMLYNGKVLSSPKSNIEKAIPGTENLFFFFVCMYESLCVLIQTQKT